MAGEGISPFGTVSRPALGSTQPLTKSVLEVKQPGVKLNTHLHWAPNLMSAAILPLPSTSSWYGA